MRIIRMVGRITLYALLIIVVTGFVYQSYFSYTDRKEFPPTGRLVDIGGYALHAKISGKDGVVVVFDAGMGDSGIVWDDVVLAIDSLATTFSYDRAGLGWSDASPLPRTSENMVAELRQLLEETGTKGPYVLVGHSLGGLNMQLFAKTYPDDVVGLVLVDSAHRNGIERLPASSSLRRKLFQVGMWAAPVGIPRAYLSNKGSAEHALKSTTKHQYTYLDESTMFGESVAALNRLSASFGDLPLTVIARNYPSDSPEFPGASGRTIVWAELQEDLSRQSSNSTLIFTGYPQHSIHKYQPDIVINAIKAMIAVVDIAVVDKEHQ